MKQHKHVQHAFLFTVSLGNRHAEDDAPVSHARASKVEHCLQRPM